MTESDQDDDGQLGAGRADWRRLVESDEWKDYNSNEQVMMEYMSRLIDTYLDTVKKNLIDSMPKVRAQRRCEA